eukprot:m.930314 g.930314  ORF g.930314 m.930314 type:complete len:357 (-) comp174465_c0_seq1:7-1077(-)
MKPSPGCVAPMPMALAALSPAPPATTTSAPRPQAFASSGFSTPLGSLLSTRRGICARVRPQAANSSSDQSRRATSSHSVPAASDGSETLSPVSCRRSQSLGSSTLVTREKISGSCFFTHNSLGAVKPGIARLPAMSCRRGAAAVSSSHSAWLRPSFHRMAARSTASVLSSSTAPCIWPDRPMPRTAAKAIGWAARSLATAASVACHQSPGACSDHSGSGDDSVSALPAVPTIRPSPSSSSSLTSEVPRSMPRNIRRSPRRPPAPRCRCPPAAGRGGSGESAPGPRRQRRRRWRRTWRCAPLAAAGWPRRRSRARCPAPASGMAHPARRPSRPARCRRGRRRWPGSAAARRGSGRQR